MSSTTNKGAQAGAATANASPTGGALSLTEQAVRFTNSEVLNPPKQGDISFVQPFAKQITVMALEDGRSFLQGAEQILLVAIAKALSELLGDASGLANAGNLQGPRPGASRALEAAERMLTILPQFHASLAETALKFTEDPS